MNITDNVELFECCLCGNKKLTQLGMLEHLFVIHKKSIYACDTKLNNELYKVVPLGSDLGV